VGGSFLSNESQVALPWLSMRRYIFLRRISSFHQLIGNNPISVQLFDKWWNITRVEVDESGFIENQIKENGNFNFAKTGLPVVDEWLKSMNNNQ
jgi:hypothetical protein